MRVSREKAAENRQRVVEVAGALFREKGFDGIGVADIMKGAGLTHGGFYGQFGSKDDLAAEAVAGALDDSVALWREHAAASSGDPLGAIAGNYLSRRHCDNVATGCPVAALGGDVARQPEAVRHAFTQGFEQLADVLSAAVPADSARQRRERTLALMAQMAGAVILARAFDDPALSDEVLAATRKAVGLSGGHDTKN